MVLMLMLLWCYDAESQWDSERDMSHILIFFWAHIMACSSHVLLGDGTLVRDYPVDGFGRIPRGFGEGKGTILVRNWALRCRLSGNLAQRQSRTAEIQTEPHGGQCDQETGRSRGSNIDCDMVWLCRGSLLRGSLLRGSLLWVSSEVACFSVRITDGSGTNQ